MSPCARVGDSENNQLIRRPEPHTTNPWKTEKDKIVGDKNEGQIRPTRMYWLSP